MYHRIQALESLRGIAAFIVFSCHFFNIFTTPSEIFSDKFGIFLNGSAAVYLFFILSGYVLSRQFFLSYSKNTLITAIFKRFFRLFPMVVVCSLIAYLLSQFHIFYNFENQEHYLQTLTIKEVFFESFFVFVNGKHFLNIFWTMRFELIGSLLVFAVIYFCFLKPSRSLPRLIFCSSGILMLLITIDISYDLLGGGGSLPFRSGMRLLMLFLIGACLCVFCHTTTKRSIISEITLSFLFIFIFYYFFKKHTLIQYPYSNSLDLLEHLFLGAFIVYGSTHISFVKRLLELPLLIKFGQISFAFYALHMIVLGSFGIVLLQYFHISNLFVFFSANFIFTCIFAYPLSKLDKFIVQKINYFFNSIFEKSASLPK